MSQSLDTFSTVWGDVSRLFTKIGATALTTPLLPVHEQLREDAALGAAWRRCEAALPKGWSLLGIRSMTMGWRACASATKSQTVEPTVYKLGDADTPTQALEALAEALESPDDR